MKFDLRAVTDEFSKTALRTSHFEFLCVSYLESKYDDLETSFNTVKPKRWCRSVADAYSPKGRCLIYCQGCRIHSHFYQVGNHLKPCPYLPIGSTPSDKNIFGQTYESRETQFRNMEKRILRECSDKIDSIQTIYQCEFEKDMTTPGNDIYNFFHSDQTSLTPKSKKPKPMVIREGLRGGMVEAFNILARATNEVEIHYWDICSLYPYTCMTNNFPVGPAVHLKGAKMTARLMLDFEKECFVYQDDDGNYKECDGIVQAEVGIDPMLHQLNEYPFLPIRIKTKGADKNKTCIMS